MKVLVLTGAESTGKSWLAARLQQRFGGLVVGEYVRHFIDREQRDTCLADIPAIARGQLAWEDAARGQRPAHRRQNALKAAQACVVTLGIWVAGGVLRLRPQRTRPSIMTMPMPGMSPRCTLSSRSRPAVC